MIKQYNTLIIQVKTWNLWGSEIQFSTRIQLLQDGGYFFELKIEFYKMADVFIFKKESNIILNYTSVTATLNCLV